MKNYLHILLVCIVYFTLSSCENQNDSSYKNLEAWLQQVSHFMGESIYQEGNQIPMITENGEEEVFVVNHVCDERAMSGSTLSAVCVRIYCESDKNKVYIETDNDSRYFRLEEAHIYGWVGMNNEVDDLSPYLIPDSLIINDFDVNQPTISITGASGTTAVFQYDVGLIQLSDTMGHTWTKK